MTLPSFWKHTGLLIRPSSAESGKPTAYGCKIPFTHLCTSNVSMLEENIWSVRITLGYRAIGILEDDTVTGFLIGSHDDYERFFS